MNLFGKKNYISLEKPETRRPERRMKSKEPSIPDGMWINVRLLQSVVIVIPGTYIYTRNTMPQNAATASYINTIFASLPFLFIALYEHIPIRIISIAINNPYIILICNLHFLTVSINIHLHYHYYTFICFNL